MATTARAGERRVVAEDILESVTDAVFAIDRDWRFDYVNAAGERLCRRARGDLLGTIVWDAFPNAIGTEYERAFRAAMDHSSNEFVDGFYIPRLDVWTSLQVSPTSAGITACIRDVSAEKRAELARIQSEQRWRALIENASDPICVLAADGCVRYGSPALQRLLGYAPGELANTNALSLVHPDELQDARELFARVMGGAGAAGEGEFRYRRKDGDWTVLFVTLTNLLDDPAVGGIVCNSHDVTKRRELEDALRTSSSRLRAMFEASPVATYAWQRDGDDFVLVDFNESAARVTKGTVRQSIGRRLREYFADMPSVIRNVHEAVADPSCAPREEIDYVYRGTGERSSVALTSVAATPDLVLIHCEDLTEQRHAEALARGLSEQVITGIYLFQDDRFTYVNRRLAEILGYSPEEIMSRRGWKWFVHESSWAEVERQTQIRLARAGNAVSYTYTAVRKDGGLVDLEVHGTSMDYPGGRALLGTVLDISERRRAESQRLMLANHVRLLLESTVEGLYGVDADGRITFVNGAGAAIVGYEPSELIGRDAHMLLHHTREDGSPYDADTCPIRRVYGGGESIRVERDMFWRRDGSSMPVSYSASPVRIGDTLAGAVVAFTDETALRDREEHLAAIVSIQEEIATARLDLAPVMRLVAERMLALTSAEGVSVELVEGDALTSRTSVGIAERYDGLRLDVARSLSGHCVRTREMAICDDTETDARVNRDAARAYGFRSMIVMPLLHDDTAIGVIKLISCQPNRFGERESRTLGLLGGLLGSAIGRALALQANELLAAERAAALEALKAREAHFRSLIENASDSILLVDAEGRITYTSPAFPRLLGYDDQSLHGRYALELVHPEDVEQAREALAALAATPNGTVAVGFRARHASGSYRTLACTGRNLLGDPAVGGIVMNLRDITGERRLEDELRQAQKMEAVGRLAGGVAHDFNNLLTIIKANTEFVLRRLADSDPGREDALEISRSADRAAALTRQLLAFSRRQVLKPREVDLNAALSDVARMIGRLIGDDIELVLDLRDDLGQVMADPGQFEQVVLNLAVNARDAMRNGGRLSITTANVDLDVSLEEHDSVVPAGSYVAMTVSDTGHGMDRATMQQIFEPFFTTKPTGEGTGLGLSTVYGIVKQSDGFITVRSQPGRGTSFTMYLPRIDGTGAGPLNETPATGVEGHETLLLVEDSDAVRVVARRILESFGYDVLEASNGDEALARAAKFPGTIHALVTDAVMPGIGGRDLAEALRRARPEVRILYMSGYTDDIIIRRGILDPGSMFLEKPFSARALAKAVREVLNQKN